ncbi:mating type protein 2, partial [Lentithecium fluviatile CBS 122367]
PRPMNCWMLYRDTRHKELKDANPDLSVQAISSICSQDWKQLPATQKDEWRAKAQAAKEEHQRMYPDYKYNPR